MAHNKSYTLGEIAKALELELIGAAESRVTGLGTLGNAGANQLSFLSNPSYTDQLASCQAAAVILSRRFADACPVSVLVSEQPYVSFAQASALFAEPKTVTAGIHPAAIVEEGAELDPTASVGANAVIGTGARIGARSVIEAGCYVGPGSRLGDDCHLHPNVTLYHDVVLGSRVSIHSGTVIGADGFGYAFDGKRSIKIHQLGGVEIGDDVEIGAGTTIDRGAIENTVIEQGVKIDNQVQIGHNCRIGAHSIICGCSALAGSVTLGRGCVLGGGSGVVGHISLTDGVQVSAMSLVSKPITKAGTYSSGTGIMNTRDWKRSIVRFQQLDSIARKLKELEKATDKDYGSSGSREDSRAGIE